MRIVDPKAAIAQAQRAPKLTRTRRKGPKLETPQEYRGSYTTMGCSLEGGGYYMRAKDPGSVFATRIKQAVKVNIEEEYALRAVAFSQGSGNSTWGRTTFGAKFMDNDEIMNLPDANGEGSLKWITDMIEKERVENSLGTMMQRLKMLLGMVGEVQEVENLGYSWAYKPKKFFKLKGYTLALFEGRDDE